MAKQPQFPMMPPIKRKTQVKRAHVCDAGEGLRSPWGAAFLCARCGWESKWLDCENEAEIRRGVPCEQCNAPPPTPQETP